MPDEIATAAEAVANGAGAAAWAQALVVKAKKAVAATALALAAKDTPANKKAYVDALDDLNKAQKVARRANKKLGDAVQDLMNKLGKTLTKVIALLLAGGDRGTSGARALGRRRRTQRARR